MRPKDPVLHTHSQALLLQRLLLLHYLELCARTRGCCCGSWFANPEAFLTLQGLKLAAFIL